MDKLNQELIEAKKRLNEIEIAKLNLDEEYTFLQDKIHLYFDSEINNTDEAEKYIIGDFWSKAYSLYKDGGYITNDEYISTIRFDYETKQLEKIIHENIKNRSSALDIGCGEGRYTKEFAKLFDSVIGLDLSKERVERNNRENKISNVKFINENFLTISKEKLGKFDFVFASDVFTYTPDREIENIFEKLLELVEDDGFLIMRESTLVHGSKAWKSKNYVAYYRNVKFYKNDIFKDSFISSYQVYGYSLYYMDKFFNVFKDKRDEIVQNPLLLDEIVPQYVDPLERSAHFYLHKINKS
jgi:2-polyprenyl-3-methyl-5-hydroxy-6-metoxy-1,4-benzoquinol methylase